MPLNALNVIIQAHVGINWLEKCMNLYSDLFLYVNIYIHLHVYTFPKQKYQFVFYAFINVCINVLYNLYI